MGSNRKRHCELLIIYTSNTYINVCGCAERAQRAQLREKRAVQGGDSDASSTKPEGPEWKRKSGESDGSVVTVRALQ